MKVLHLSTHDIAGGASRAAYRVHRCMLGMGLDSRMYVRSKTSKDGTVQTRTDFFGRFYFQLLPLLNRAYGKLQRSADDNSRSYNPAPTLSLRRHIRPQEYDVVMLHFLGQGYLNYREIGRITQPIVWLVHDMWPFCGGEHYTEDGQRFTQGYRADNRSPGDRGLDLDRHLWRGKRKRWANPNVAVVGASRWISELARKSLLFANAKHDVIPYPLDTGIYQPQDKTAARRLFGLPQDRKLVLFGAVGGVNDRRKGFDLLVDALKKVARQRRDADLVVFGNPSGGAFPDVGLPCHTLGILRDDYSLAMLYSAADVLAAPSRIDNLPQIVLESQCCGTPCVAFNVGGMPDMIEHHRTGFLAASFSTDEFAAGIEWVIEASGSKSDLAHDTREIAVVKWNEEGIGKKYLELLNDLTKQAAGHWGSLRR
jgi:glycosyltransferase involved in cell wall biosynthesis